MAAPTTAGTAGDRVEQLDRPVADLVVERPGRATIFERFGIDYCCHGQRTVADAAAAAGVDPRAVLDMLEVFDAGAASVQPAGSEAPTDPVALVEHILATHHAYLHEELPELRALAAKVAEAHRSRHPELDLVRDLVAEVADDLEAHLAREEEVVFPAITSGRHDLVASVSELEADHVATADQLAALREATGDHTVPADACPSYQALYQRLKALESDTFRHVHLENNVLFPAALAGSRGV